MRVRLASCPPGLVERLRALSADARWLPSHSELLVPGPATARPAVLNLVREAGGEIRGLTAEEERLDVFYRELVAESAREKHA